MPRLSIIIPSYNDGDQVKTLCKQLLCFDTRDVEIIVVESGEHGYLHALDSRIKKFRSHTGRAKQMNAGAKKATGEILWFLHADSWVSEKAIEQLRALDSMTLGGAFLQRWRLEFIKDTARGDAYCQKHLGMRIRPYYLGALFYSALAKLSQCGVWWRSLTKRRFFGDQAIFVQKEIFTKMGGFKEIELFEDVEFSDRLKAMGKTRVLTAPVFSSTRAFEKLGILRYAKLCKDLLRAYDNGTEVSQLAAVYHRRLT